MARKQLIGYITGSIALGLLECFACAILNRGLNAPDPALNWGTLGCAVGIANILVLVLYRMSRPSHKEMIGYIVSSNLGSFMGWVAFAVTLMWLNTPDTPLDWTVQVCSGLTVGIVIFFLSWGHFQDPPKVGQNQR